MEKHRLSHALLSILKKGKYKNMYRFCFRIRHNCDLCKHSAGFYGSWSQSSYCSFIKENKENLLKPTDDCPFISEQLQKSSAKEITCEASHSSQPEALSAKFCRDSNNELKLSYKSLQKQCILFRLYEGRCFGIIMRRVFLKLKRNQLLSEEQRTNLTSQTAVSTGPNSLCVSEVQNVSSQNGHFDCLDRTFPSQMDIQSSRKFGLASANSISSIPSSSTAKDIFNYKFYLKYQNPSPDKVQTLSALFANPEKIVDSVTKNVVQADGNYTVHLVVTDHLKHRYWKACLTITWPEKITVQGTHPERDMAIYGAHLHMCEHLQNMGLIYENEDGVWVPMTCNKVMMILEKLSKYRKSVLGYSRGSGFKIILKQIKDMECDKAAKASNSLVSFRNRGVNKATEDVDDGRVARFGNIDSKFCQASFESSIKEDTDVWNSETIAACNSPTGIISEMVTWNPDSNVTSDNQIGVVSQIAVENLETVSICKSGARHRSKPKWLCTVHVGWPFPFSVHAEGLSLPAAQMMGHMAVISKLKSKKLLAANNSSLNRQQIEQIILHTTKQLWQKSIQQYTDKAYVHKFNADAIMFSDASVKGFGAFLSVAGTEKVSWLSEQWDEHKVDMLRFQSNKLHLHTILAELYALVTAVFTWKQKLRSQKLLCYSDNTTVVCIINLLALDLIHQDTHINSLDHLIHTLQMTCHEYSITLQGCWLDRQENVLADCLSRQDFVTFHAAIPEAAINKTKAKRLVVKGDLF